MNILDRYKKPTPDFFKFLRNLGICFATAGGTIIAAPIAAPEWLISAATYLVVIGTVITAVCQATVSDTLEPPNSNGDGV